MLISNPKFSFKAFFVHFYKFLGVLSGLLLLSLEAEAQFSPKDSLLRSVKPFVMIQNWATFTFNERADLTQNDSLSKVDNRANFFFRRARLGFKGEPHPRLKYALLLFYDNLGKDEFSGVRGNANNEANFGIWDAFIQWNITPAHDLLHLTAGYFRPQISRENLTSAWEVNSFEKAISQSYVRRQLVERNHGRATGLNLGGLWLKKRFGLYYNLGVFSTTNQSTDPLTQGNSSGVRWSPLWAGRIAVSLGQSEMQKYSIAHEINYYGKRRGISLGLYASSQGTTDLFDQAQILGADVLFNYNRFNFDAELNLLHRAKDQTAVNALTGHVRGGINLFFERVLLEPSVMYSFFKAQNTESLMPNFFDGEESIWDIGINWYIQRTRLKLNLHYVWQQGQGQNNLYTREKGRRVAKGNYLGLGFQFII